MISDIRADCGRLALYNESCGDVELFFDFYHYEMFNDTTTDIKLFVGEADSLQLTIWLDGDYLIQESIDVTIHKGEISTPTLSADAGCVAFQNHCYQPVNVSYLDTSITINPITTQIVKIPMGTEESRLLTVGWSGLFLYPGENSFYVQRAIQKVFI